MRLRSPLAATTLLLLAPFVASASAETLDPDRVGGSEKAYYDTGFEDVGSDHVFADEIAWLAGTGISTGYERPDGFVDFRPAAPVLREQMAAFLYRFATESSVDEDGPAFTDVLTSHTFFHQIEWLAGTRITTGYENGDGTTSFRGSQPVLREQMAAFLYRYAGSPTSSSRCEFTDVPQTHVFRAAICWLASTGITTGYPNGDGTRSFRGSQPVLREQMAAFLYRLDGTDVPPLSWLAGEALGPDVSADGRYVVFQSADSGYAEAFGLPGNGRQQIYLADRVRGELTLVSESVTGTLSNGDTRYPHISGDGRYVTWGSDAADLVVGDAGDSEDAFLFDRANGSVSMINRVPDGSAPTLDVTPVAMSADGSTIGLVTTDWSSGFPDSRPAVVPRTGGAIEPIPNHTGPGIRYGFGASFSLSADGSVVAVTNGAYAWAWHRGDALSLLISGDRPGGVGMGVVSPDGTEILFSSDNRGLAGPDVDFRGNYVYRHELATGTLSREQTDDGRPLIVSGDTDLELSADGRHLAMTGQVVHILDRQNDRTTLVTRGLRGAPLDGQVYSASFSGDGNHVVFSAYASNLQPVWAPRPFTAAYVWERPVA